MTVTPRTALLVVGMHRSGTSALTRLISRLGYALPRTLLGANAGNPFGHWESTEVIRFNDELLAAAGSDWVRFDAIDGRLGSVPNRDALLRQGVALMKSEFGRSRRFVLKDPRICRLLPFWLDTLAASGADPRLIFTSRAPGEVAASLAARDGLAPCFVELAWLRSVLDAEAAGRGRPRVHLTYTQLLTDWRGVVARLCDGLALPKPRITAQVKAEIDATLRPEHRHHRDTPLASIGRTADWIATVAEILQRWAMSGEDGRDHATLDGVSGAFDDLMASIGPTLLSGLSGIIAAQLLRGASEALVAERRRFDVLDYAARTMLGHAEAAWLRSSALFDADWYLRHYPDVAAAMVDPVEHYLSSGATEGRDPGPHFSTRAYLAAHPEIEGASINPLSHFLLYGDA